MSELIIPRQDLSWVLPQVGSVAGYVCEVVFSDGTTYSEVSIDRESRDPVVGRMVTNPNGTVICEPDPEEGRYPYAVLVRNSITQAVLDNLQTTGMLFPRYGV